MAGFLELEQARVKWFLSVDAGDLPYEPTPGFEAPTARLRLTMRRSSLPTGLPIFTPVSMKISWRGGVLALMRHGHRSIWPTAKIRVMILLEDEDTLWNSFAMSQFMKDYSEKDAIHDSL